MIDAMMPGMSGDQLVAELRRHPVFDDVPLVILTAKADDQLRLSLLSSNIQAYLSKPFETQEVQAWADNLITRRLQLLKEWRSQGERLRSHAENSPLGVIETDAEFRVTYWSPRSEEMFGWRTAEVLGKRPEEFRFIYEEDRETFAWLGYQRLCSDHPMPPPGARAASDRAGRFNEYHYEYQRTLPPAARKIGGYLRIALRDASRPGR
jgi:PAS domain S-box-containing protein